MTEMIVPPVPPVGILMLDTRFPRPPGDIGNPATFDFPIRYRVVERATPTRVVLGAADGLVGAFCDAARELEGEGACAIATSCGFLALHQPSLAAAVRIPVLTSALLQVPLVLASLAPDQQVGVVTFSATSLTPGHFAGCGVTSLDRVTVIGLEGAPSFHGPILASSPEMDLAAVEREVVEIVADAVASRPEIGALVLECTNLPPYAAALQRATGLPIWDVTLMVRWAHAAGIQRRYHGGP